MVRQILEEAETEKERSLPPPNVNFNDIKKAIAKGLSDADNFQNEIEFGNCKIVAREKGRTIEFYCQNNHFNRIPPKKYASLSRQSYYIVGSDVQTPEWMKLHNATIKAIKANGLKCDY